MFRAFTAAAILALTVTAAQAAPATDDPVLDARAHQVANNVCDPLMQTEHFTSQFYQNWFKDCMRTTSAEATKQLEAKADQYRVYARND